MRVIVFYRQGTVCTFDEPEKAYFPNDVEYSFEKFKEFEYVGATRHSKRIPGLVDPG